MTEVKRPQPFDREQAARQLVRMLRAYHADAIEGDDRDKRAAAAIKSAALVALAFDFPPTEDGRFDLEEILSHLEAAVIVLHSPDRVTDS